MTFAKFSQVILTCKNERAILYQQHSYAHDRDGSVNVLDFYRTFATSKLTFICHVKFAVNEHTIWVLD